MALIFADSCQHLNPANSGASPREMAIKYTIGNGVISATGGRFGGKSNSHSAPNLTAQTVNLEENAQTHVILGQSAKLSGLNQNIAQIQFRSADLVTPTNGDILFPVVRWTVGLDGTMSLSAQGWKQNGASFIQTPTIISPSFIWGQNAIRLTEWYVYEIKVDWAGGNGPMTITARVNEQVVMTWTPQYQGSPVLAGDVKFGQITQCVSANVNDVIISDSHAADVNSVVDFLGDVTVGCLFARADGTVSGWVPNFGSELYTKVNEFNNDRATSYIETVTPGSVATFAYDLVSGLNIGQIYAVQTNILAWKEDASARKLKAVCEPNGGALVEDTVEHSPNSSVIDFRKIYESVPGTSDPWTHAKVDNSKFGVKDIS